MGEVQPHEIEAEDPDPQRLMMAGEDRPGQVVEAAGAVPALGLRRAGRLGLLPSLLGHALAVGATGPVSPGKVPDHLVALVGVVDERLDVEHRWGPILGARAKPIEGAVER